MARNAIATNGNGNGNGKKVAKPAPEKEVQAVNTEAANNVGDNLPAVSKALDGEVQKSKFNPKPLTLAEAEKAILKIVKSADDTRKIAHETACGILMHYAEHGDYTALRRPLVKNANGRMVIDDKQPMRLYEVIEKHISRSMARALVNWVVAHSSLRWNEDTKQFYHNRRDSKIPADKRGYVDIKAFDQPFWDFEPEVPTKIKALSEAEVMAIVANAIKRLVNLEYEKNVGRKIKEGEKEKTYKPKHQVDDEMVSGLLKFATEHGIKFDTEVLDKAKEAGVYLQ